MSGGLGVCECQYLGKTYILASERMPNLQALVSKPPWVPMICTFIVTPHILARSLMHGWVVVPARNASKPVTHSVKRPAGN